MNYKRWNQESSWRNYGKDITTIQYPYDVLKTCVWIGIDSEDRDNSYFLSLACWSLASCFAIFLAVYIAYYCIFVAIPRKLSMLNKVVHCSFRDFFKKPMQWIPQEVSTSSGSLEDFFGIFLQEDSVRTLSPSCDIKIR